MVLRIGIAAVVIAMSLLVQARTAQVSGPRQDGPGMLVSLLDPQFTSVAVADNASGDNASGDNASGDNDSGDNASGDNDSGDNAGNPDEDIVIENVSPSAAPAADGPAATEAIGTSAGSDARIALAGDRIVVTLFPTMPAGITLTVRLIDPTRAPATPGTRVGDLIFALEALDSTGRTLTTLPAEVNLDVTYSERDVAGLNNQAVTLSWLDPADNQWKVAPKLVTNPAGNTVAASVTQLGTYVISVR